VVIAVLVGIVLPLGLVAVARFLGGTAEQSRGAVPELPRLFQLTLGAILVLLLVPFVVAIGGLAHGYTVVEMLLLAAVLGAGALSVARAGSSGAG
jgi:hypothetical protein